jgi:flagellar FliJ protein
MKSRESVLRLKRFTAEEKARKVADLQQMLREFEHMASDLDRQVLAEEERTGVKDRAHFSYSMYAKAAAQRRDNLRASIADLLVKLEIAARERDEAKAELAKTSASESREEERGHHRAEHRSGAALR